MNAQKLLTLVAYILVALVALTAAKGYYAEQKRPNERPFMMGMRYGRADKSIKTSNKHVIVAPRNDKFFLASRYGKRSNDIKHPSLIYPIAPLCINNGDMTCTYTGVSDIYRCNQSFGKVSSPDAELSAAI